MSLEQALRSALHWRAKDGGERPDESDSSDESVASERGPEARSLPVLPMRWSHDCIKLSFRDGRLLVSTLRDLLERRLRVDQLPKFVVVERGGTYHAITGNRRLWVLKEFARVTGAPTRVGVKVLGPGRSNSAWVRRMWTTVNDGASVDFVVKNKHRLQAGAHYPSMAFALAAAGLDRRLPLRQHDLRLGAAIAVASGTSAARRLRVEQLSETVGWGVGQGTGCGPLRDYLAARPCLYVLPTEEAPFVRLAGSEESWGANACFLQKLRII